MLYKAMCTNGILSICKVPISKKYPTKEQSLLKCVNILYMGKKALCTKYKIWIYQKYDI